MFLSEKLKSLLILVKNQHRICAYKCNWAVAQTHRATEKRRFVSCNESSLSFCLLSDMLTKVSVIFSFENSSPMARYFQKKVILNPTGSVIFYSPETCEANNTRRKAEYHCVAISLAVGE